MKQTSVRRGFFILSRTNLVIKIISIIYVPLLLAILGPAGHGDYALAYVYYGALVSLLSDALTKIMIRRISALEVRGQSAEAIAFTNHAKRLIIRLALCLAVLVLVASGWLAQGLHAPHLRSALMVLGLSLIGAGLSAVYRSYFQASRKMELAANSLIIEHVVNATLTISLAYVLQPYGLSLSLAGAAGGSFVGSSLSALYLHLKYNKRIKQVEPVVIGDEVLQLMKPLLLLSLGVQVGSMLEALVIKLRLSGLGLSEALASTVYSDVTSYKMAQSIPMIVVSAMATALYPAITESVAQGEIKQFYHRVEQAIRTNYLITIPAAAGIALVARELVQFVFDGRLEREELMIGGAFMIVLMGIGLIQSVILQADGRMLVSQIPLVVSIFIQVIADIIFIREPYGVYGILIAGYLGLMGLLVCNEYLLKRRHLKLNYTKDFVKPLVATIVMTLCLIGLKLVLSNPSSRGESLLQLLGLMLAGVLSYLIALLFVKGITRTDISLVSDTLYDKLPRKLKSFIGE